jgi:mycothione reductase
MPRSTGSIGLVSVIAFLAASIRFTIRPLTFVAATASTCTWGRRFVAPRVLQVGAEQMTADRIVVAVGSRPVLPDIPGLDDVDFPTTDNIMRIPEIPTSMLVVGGGTIAAELGHVFDAFGSEVTIVQRGPRLLATEDTDVSDRFTDLARRRWRVVVDAGITSVTGSAAGVAV